ncbi:MAG: IPT/TIG domain-containing protein [Bryobacterales bacterium]
MRFIRPLLLLVVAAGLASAQLNNASLSGRYYFVHLLVTVSPAGEASSGSNLGGTITFDGAGGYSFQGRQGVDSGGPTAGAGNGVYSVNSAGFVELTNPILQQQQLNARLGINSEALVGSSTEADGTFDLFVAIKAPADGVSNALLNGAYSGGSLWFPNGRDTATKTAFLRLTPNGGGVFPGSQVIGHAADAGETTSAQALTNATYALSADGSGTASFGTSASLFSGNHDVFVSADGNYFIGYSTEPGGREIFLAIKSFSNSASNSSWNGTYWIAEIFADLQKNSYAIATGAVHANGAGQAVLAERNRVEQSTIDFSGLNSYVIRADSTGTLAGKVVEAITDFAIGAPGANAPNAFVQALIEEPGVALASEVHGLAFGVRVPDITGSGVFLSPLGIVNGASFAPATHPISGGSLLSLFGEQLAPSPQSFQTVPLPTNLAGVTVTINGVLAPLFFVAPTQINLQAPFAVSGETATIVVSNNGNVSNEVEVPVANSSPGIFSRAENGIGFGTITHADGSNVTPEDPALPGETVVIYLTGLGEVNPPIADGAQGPSAEPFSRVTDPEVLVQFDREAGRVVYAGASPCCVGLYQINVTIPSTVVVGDAVPVAIVTTNAVSDLVDISIGL